MKYFEISNSWYEYLQSHSVAAPVQLVMYHLIQQNNLCRNAGEICLTDRDLQRLTGYGPGVISAAKKVINELGFVKCETVPGASRHCTRYVFCYKSVAKSVAKPIAKTVAKTIAKSADGGRPDAEKSPPKKYKKLRRKKEIDKEKNSPGQVRKDDFEACAGEAEAEPKPKDEPDFEAYAREAQAARAKEPEDLLTYLKNFEAKEAERVKPVDEPDLLGCGEVVDAKEPAKDEPDFLGYLKVVEERKAKAKPDFSEGGIQHDEPTTSDDAGRAGGLSGSDEPSRQGARRAPAVHGHVRQLAPAGGDKRRGSVVDAGAEASSLEEFARADAAQAEGELLYTVPAGMGGWSPGAGSTLSAGGDALLPAVWARRRAG